VTDFELVKFQHEHVTGDPSGVHVVDGCDVCKLLDTLMRLRRENDELRELVDKMTSGLRHKG